MADKKRYYKLDEIGLVGKQEKESTVASNYRSKKTGEIFRQARAAESSQQGGHHKLFMSDLFFLVKRCKIFR